MSAPTDFDAARALRMAVRTFEIEARGLSDLASRLGGSEGAAFAQAVHTLLACRGRVVVMGMGKSGHVGRKIAATLASTGTPAFFVHPAEASHGDLGMVTREDVVIDPLVMPVGAMATAGLQVFALVDQGIESISLNPDTVVETWMFLAGAQPGAAPGGTRSTAPVSAAISRAMPMTLLRSGRLGVTSRS